jgi:hypothetical protein
MRGLDGARRRLERLDAGTASPASSGRRPAIAGARRPPVNLLIKKIKRVGHGFCNTTNYRLRLLHRGVRWQTPQTARRPGRSPRLVA